MPAGTNPNEDAGLLLAASQEFVRGKPSSSSKSLSFENNSNTDSLARSNLLRLETAELIKESILHIHPSTARDQHDGDGGHGDVRVHEEAKWAPSVREYLNKIKDAISSLDETTLSPNVAILPNNDIDSDAQTSPPLYRIPLLSDKFQKSLPFAAGAGVKGKGERGVVVNVGHHDNTSVTNTSSWSFPFHGGSSLTLVPIGSFGHIGNAGLANRHANGGNVLPVLDVAVLVDDNKYDASSAFVGGKDYLNHRYTDVSLDQHHLFIGCIALPNVPDFISIFILQTNHSYSYICRKETY